MCETIAFSIAVFARHSARIPTQLCRSRCHCWDNKILTNMGRKRNPVLPIFTRDILSSPRCRALSEQAAGIYFFLLCRLNEPPQPGAYRLSDWELHPNWRRSKTQQCLATADKYERLPYFAAMLAKNDLPWRQKNILAGLQELYKYGIITIEGDMLVQPRMYKDNGFRLPEIDQDGDPEGTILDDPASGNMATLDGDKIRPKKRVQKTVGKSAEISTVKSTGKVHEKEPVSHAHAHSNERGDRDNNILKDKGNTGGTGDISPVSKNGKNNPVGRNNRAESRAKTAIQKTDVDTPNAKKKPSKRLLVADNPPTLEEVQAYFDEMATKGKPFQYVTPETFFDACEQSGWRLKDGKPMVSWQARVRTFENFRREHGDRPVGSPPQIRSPQQAITADQSQTMTVGEDNFAGQEKW